MNTRDATRTPIRITAKRLAQWPLEQPDRDDDKDGRGRVLVIGGCREIPGAVILSAEAALRAGAGKLQIATVADVACAVAVTMPEARVIGLPADRAGNIKGATTALKESVSHADAVLVGPGMFVSRATSALVSTLLEHASRLPLRDQPTFVLDAGALAADLAPMRDGARVILTPHAGEMAALSGAPRCDIESDAAGSAHACASRLRCVTVLKGATTHLSLPDGTLYSMREGDVGLGTSGSGDVLAGIIAGLAARGIAPERAAAWGVFAHARAGQVLAKRMARVGFLARELLAEVPRVLDGRRSP